MSKTLCSQLSALNQSRVIRQDLCKAGLTSGEVRLIGSFYENNPLALAVARGETSYNDRTEFIQRRYDGLGDKFCKPKLDRDFDESVQEVIGSINNVGVAKVVLDPCSFTTEGRRKHLSGRDITHLGLGALAGMMVVSVEYFFNAGSPLMLGTFGSFEVGWWGFGRLISGADIFWDLDNLQRSAQQTDKFLRDILYKG
jgi:hypothetical protein